MYASYIPSNIGMEKCGKRKSPWLNSVNGFNYVVINSDVNVNPYCACFDRAFMYGLNI